MEERERSAEDDAAQSDQQASGSQEEPDDDALQSEPLHEKAPRAEQTELAPTRTREPEASSEDQAPREWPFPWMQALLDALELVPNVGGACRQAHIGRTRAYQVRNANEEFAAAWLTAIENGLDRVERASLEAAVVGDLVVRETYRKDGTLASRTEERKTSYQDRRMMLAAYRPEKFRERYEVKETKDDEVDAAIIALAQKLGIKGRGEPVPNE